MSIGTWYLTRDPSGALVAHKEPPRKGKYMWDTTDGEICLNVDDGIKKDAYKYFSIITWELDTPFRMDDFNPLDYKWESYDTSWEITCDTPTQ